MRWTSFRDPEGRERVGLVRGDAIVSLPAGLRLLDVLESEGGLQAAAERWTRREPDFALKAVNLLAPVPKPPSIRDFYAFEQHVRTARQRRGLEMDTDWYELPVFYFTNPAAVLGPGEVVRMPPGTQQLDFELEVAAIVGAEGSNLGPEEAENHIAGYCVMNDWSARDIQRREMKLSLGPAKGKDFATTLGPFLVSPEELEPWRKGRAFDLTMTASVNGREYSQGSLAEIYWSFGEMVAYASRGTRVLPGDVIGSGTCGTGCILELSLVHGDDAYPWLKPGDEVVLEVEGLGRLENRVGDGLPMVPLRPGPPS